MPTILEYVWIDSTLNLRSKIRISPNSIDNLSSVPVWNFDGSSTGQASVNSSEIILKPVYMTKSPFESVGNSYLVLCACYDITLNPAINNNYYAAKKLFNLCNAELYKPWFGLEQEFYFENKATKYFSLPNHYCGVESTLSDQRKLMDEFISACITSNLTISGMNAEVAASQWEFQIGPVYGINAAHELWLARYILNRIANKYNYKVNYQPKPYDSISGSGLHTNFSTEEMREESGFDAIMKSMAKLNNSHTKYIELCGINNDKRLTGSHETSSVDNFTYGIGDRTASVRIPFDTYRNQRGYFEDRRPGANADPYLITSNLFRIVTDDVDLV